VVFKTFADEVSLVNYYCVCELQVQYLSTEDVLIQNLTLRNSITLTDLKPHRNYTFTVVVRSGTESQVLRRSLPVSAIFTTMESVPGKVGNLVSQ